MTPSEPVTKRLAVSAAMGGKTVLEAVRAAFPGLSPREVFRNCRTGTILLGGKRTSATEKVRERDFLDVTVDEDRPVPEKPVTRAGETVDTPAGPLHIVREDEDLLAVSKPPGCASHPALRRSGNTLVDRVVRYLGPGEDGFRPALANRLDIDTSGIVLVGKNALARTRLGHDVQKRRMEKRYLALIAGRAPDSGDITLSLERKPDSRDLAARKPGDAKLLPRVQEAHTRYRTLARSENPLHASLVEVELLTGRTHQIRRHFAAAGMPVALDKTYGDPVFDADIRAALTLDRMFLHAERVVLPHPVTRHIIEIISPLPAELALCLAELGIKHP